MFRIVVLCLLLAGCTEPQILRGSGDPAPTPAGHDDLCKKEKKMPGCPK